MAQIIVSRRLENMVAFEKVAALFGNKRWAKEAHRGVIDAARKTKTQVQHAVRDQMAVKPGSYQSYVVRNMRLKNNAAMLSATIFASAKGGQITDFKGLRELSINSRLRTGNRSNLLPGAKYRRSKSMLGTVRSTVWNTPRIFKRSFASNGGYFALIRASGAKGNSTMPKAFWTHDSRSNQPRDAAGRFAPQGAQKWRTRRLRGPALNKELDQGKSAQVFLTFGPAELERQVMKRMTRLMKW